MQQSIIDHGSLEESTISSAEVFLHEFIKNRTCEQPESTASSRASAKTGIRRGIAPVGNLNLSDSELNPNGPRVFTWVLEPDNPEVLAPIGSIGELWIEVELAGQQPQLDDGSEKLDSPTLLCHGNSEQTGNISGLYRTGNLVRCHGDGKLVYVGPKESFARIRGEKVVLHEVEENVRHVLQVSGDVLAGEMDIVAQTLQPIEASDTEDDHVLLAFVAPRGSQSAREDTGGLKDEHIKATRRITSGVRSQLAGYLPSHMVPDAIIPIERLPKTAQDKVDLSQLRSMAMKSSWMDFWQISTLRNTFSSCEKHTEVLDRNTSSLLLRDSNRSMRTEPSDIMLGVMAHSFFSTFLDCSMVNVLVKTLVGTQLAQVSAALDSTVFTEIRNSKDARRAGYKANQTLQYNNKIDISFSFHEEPESELKHVSRGDEQSEPPSALRQAIIDIEARTQDGQIFITFTFNRHMNHRPLFHRWMRIYTEQLSTAAQDLLNLPLTFTPSDFPLVALSYEGIDAIVNEVLPSMQLGPEDVADICPCSPLQEGILLSSSSYAVYWVWRCKPHDGNEISPSRLEAAWKAATKQHKIFSTIFGLHPEESSYVQFVLNDVEMQVSQITTDGCPAITLAQLPRPEFTAYKPKHAFTICQSETGDVACRFDVCHTLYDTYSLSILLQDALSFYNGKTPPIPQPFSDVVRHIKTRPRSETTDFWINALKGMKACRLPVLRSLADAEMQDVHGAIFLPTESLADVTGFCSRNGITRSIFMHIAWALVLSHYTGMEDVCFGYMASGRDAPVDGINRIFGPLANMMVSRIDLRKPLRELFKSTAAILKEHRKHQQTSLAEVQHTLGISGGLFNTMINLLRTNPFGAGQQEGFSFEKHCLVSPHEFDIVIEGYLDPDKVNVTMYYRTAFISHQVAQEVSTILIWAANYLVSTESWYEKQDFVKSPQSTEYGNGDDPAVDHLPEQFFKHIVGKDRRSTEAFWKRQFEDLGTSDIVSSSRGAISHPRDADVELTIEGLVWTGLHTAETMIRAAWAVMAAQLSESTDVFFGVNFIGCQPLLPGIEKLLGANISAVPFRLSVNWDVSVKQFLKTVHDKEKDISAFEGPGLHWFRQLGNEALTACDFQSLLIVKSASQGAEQIQSGECDEAEQMYGKHAITINCCALEDKLRLRVNFNSERMCSTKKARITHQFEYILRQLADPERWEDQLVNIASIGEQDLEDVWRWNAIVPKQAEISVVDLFQTEAISHPDSIAIHAWDGDLTYEQLDELSTKLARYLIANGIGPGATIPLCFEKSKWMSVAMVGVVKTGAAGAGIDPKQPETRLRAVMMQLEAPLILSSTKNMALAQRIGTCEVLGIDGNVLSKLNTEKINELPPINLSQNLYIVFTSGSTGIPKGVVINHRSYASAVIHQHECFGFSRTSRVFDFSSYAFDAAWFNLFHTLTSGGCLCVPSDDERQNNLESCFSKYEITVAFLTPSVSRHISAEILGQLETLMIGGEVVLPSHVSIPSHKTQIKIIYGPSECTPMTTSHELPASGSIAIGRGVGVCTWVVNPNHPQSLTPVGMVGELWLEGPLVGQGYLKDSEKTSSAFVEDPEWLLRGTSKQPGRHGRLYRTGDLVRYENDGTIVYVQRKDTQVKIRGQRVELSEVEQHVSKSLEGFAGCAGNWLVVAETIHSDETGSLLLIAFTAPPNASSMSEEECAKLVKDTAAAALSHLSEVVPAYMLPNAFIPIQNFPMSITGKTDRAHLRKLGTKVWKQYGAPVDGIESSKASNDVEVVLQEVWMAVLNLPAEAVSVNKPFTRLGGDSITAMQVVSRCRTHGISLTVGNILQASSIQKLALQCNKTVQNNALPMQDDNEKDTSEPFGLSPIQSKFFDIFPQGINFFNQSFVLDLNQSIPSTTLNSALKTLVTRHGMLRARYRKDADGNWQQFIAEINGQCFSFANHIVAHRSEVLQIAQDRQAKLDILDGPVFAADLFNVAELGQMLVLTAHHLVVDLVSWRIIWNDLEEHIKSGKVCPQTAPSFRVWCQLQYDMAKDLKPEDVLEYNIPNADPGFWGVLIEDNTRAVSEDCITVLDSASTELLLGSCNDSLRTEALEIILGAYAYSFQQAFPERNTPAIFLEGHGREQSKSLPIDVSGTVGWFTTVHPLVIDISSESTIIDTVRIAKDARRRIPGKGQPYFASRYHSQSCQQQFKDHDNVELLLNFAGRYQQLESSCGLFSLAEPFEGGRNLEVVSQSSKRLALVEANMAVQGGRLVTTFTFNQNMRHQERLRRWFQDFNLIMESAVQALQQTAPSLTLSDLPLMSMTPRGLNRLMRQQLPGIGIKPEDVVDMYPTSPLQEGILLSSNTGLSSYATFWIWRCIPTDATQSISPSRLEAAWRQVVGRHAILSTIFGTHPEDSKFVQTVLNRPHIRALQKAINTDELTEVLYKADRPSFVAGEPQHAFTIGHSQAGDVACRLDINHTLLDGVSLTPLVQDLAAAYDSHHLPPAPSFKEMVQYVGSINRGELIGFWTKFLQGVKPCEVVTSHTPAQGIADTFRYIHLPTKSTAGISDFCKSIGVTRAIFLQVAWAMVLSQLTGMDEVCFGYLASGRDAPVDQIDKMVGPLANMLVSRINLAEASATVLKTVSANCISHLEYQHVSLAEVQHEIGLSGRRLFNTAITVREEDRFDEGAKRSIKFQLYNYQDPHEYDLLLSSRLEKDSTNVSIQIREATISSQLAAEAANLLTAAIDTLLTVEDKSSRHVEKYHDNNYLGADTLYDGFFHHINGRDKASIMAFWKEQFVDLDATCVPRPNSKNSQQQGKKRSEVEFKVEQVNLGLSDITISAVVRAAWSIVAARNAGSSDSLFGVCLSRSILPIRIGIDWDSSVRNFLLKVQRQMADLRPFGHSSLQTIRQASNEAAMACNFQTVLVIDNNDGSVEGTSQDLEAYDLAISCRFLDNKMEFFIQFDHAVVSTSDMSRIASQFEHVLLCLSEPVALDNKLRDVATVSPLDLQAIWAWNAILPKATESCVQTLIYQSVKANSEAPAICAWDGELTYKQLDQISTTLAYRLVEMGVGPGKVVPIFFEKSMWAAVAMLAVMKSGAASTAMDTTQPLERLRAIASQLNGSLILCSNAKQDLAGCLGIADTFIVGPEQLSDCGSTKMEHDLPTPSPCDIIYVVFTSGSTGTPKGAMITHQNFSSIISYQSGALGLSSDSRVYDFASYAFDIAWCNLLHTLTCGGCLCIPSEADRRDDIEGSIKALQANYAHITPTVLRYLDWSKIETINVLNLSGEAVLPSDIALVPQGIKVINAYGPAETNVVTLQDITASTLKDVSIGRGYGACTWVVDTEKVDSLAPIGAVGELWIEGPLVGKGYFNDEVKTANAFVENPAWLLRGTDGYQGRRGTLYRTGDLVRYNDNGTLAYLGRKDTQVKIRGQRVELGEVEHQVHVALETTEIRNANVVVETAQPQQADGILLVAFISLDRSDDMTESDHSNAVKKAAVGLSERLLDVLPAYMVPSVYIPIREMPRTATGKTSRRELREAVSSKSMEEIVSLGRFGSDRRQPGTSMERVMQRLWADVLNTSPECIGADDSFFRIGGDSIGAMRLVSLARDQDLVLTVRDVFQCPILHSLSSLAVSQNPDQDKMIQPFTLLISDVGIGELLVSASSQLKLSQDKIVDIVPCTPLQVSLMARSVSEGMKLSSTHMLRICKTINLDTFRAAWNQVVSRNPIARTRIIHILGYGWVQVILDDTVVWITSETREEYQEYADRNPMASGTRLMRFGIVESGDSGSRDFAWELHWAVYDGWALRLLLAEAENIYANRRTHPLESTSAFIKHIKSIDNEQVGVFWKHQFSNNEGSHFPVTYSSTHRSELDEAHITVQDMNWNIGDFTDATIIRAALSLVIAQNLNSAEAIFGATVTGRQAAVAGIEHMAGPAFATLPIRISINWEASVQEFLESVQKQAVDMIPFEQTGLEQIRQVSSEATLACDFKTLLVIQSAIRRGDPRYQEENSGMFSDGLTPGKGAIVELGQRTGAYPLYVECNLDARQHGRIDLRVCYDSGAVEQQQIEYLLNQLPAVLQRLSNAAWNGGKLKDVVLK